MKGTVFGVMVVVTMPAAMEAGWAELFSLLEDGVLVSSTLALIHELKRSYLEGSAASNIYLLVSRQTGPSHHRPMPPPYPLSRSPTLCHCRCQTVECPCQAQ